MRDRFRRACGRVLSLRHDASLLGSCFRFVTGVPILCEEIKRLVGREKNAAVAKRGVAGCRRRSEYYGAVTLSQRRCDHARIYSLGLLAGYIDLILKELP